MNAKRRLLNGILILSLMVFGLSAASASAAPSPSLRISHVSCVGCDSPNNIEVHFVLVNVDGEIADYGGVSYTMQLPGGGTIEGMAGFTGHTGNAIHYTQHISGEEGMYVLLGGSVTVTFEGGGETTFNLDNVGETYNIDNCEPCEEPTPEPPSDPPSDPPGDPPLPDPPADPKPEPPSPPVIPPQPPVDPPGNPPVDPEPPEPPEVPGDPIDPGEVPPVDDGGDDDGEDPVAPPVEIAEVPPSQPEAPVAVLLPETGGVGGNATFGIGLLLAGMVTVVSGVFISRRASRKV